MPSAAPRFLCLVPFTLLAASMASAQWLVAVDSGRQLYAVDRSTGAKTQFATVSANAGTTGGLAHDAATHTTYLTSTTQDSLYTLDLLTGTATLIGAYGDPAIVMHGLEWDSSTGTLYGVSSHNNGLYRISTVTGAATLVGTSGLTSFTNLVYDATRNAMFATNSSTDSLYQISRSSGAATLIGALGGPTNPNGLAYDPQRQEVYLIDSGTDNLYWVNVITGAATLIGPTGAGNLLGLAHIPLSFTLRSACTTNAVFQLLGYPTSAAGAGSARQAFSSTGTAGINQLFETVWAYRLGNDTRESIFNQSPGSGIGLALVAPPDTAVLNWTNCDGRGFDAQLTFGVYSTGAAAGVVTQRMTITNRTAAAMQFNAFIFADLDVSGSAGSDRATFVNYGGQQQEIVDDTTQARCYFMACANGAYETNGFSLLRGKLTNATVDNLNSTGVPYGPGDWTSAYQWRDWLIAPGASVTFYSAIGAGLPIQCCTPTRFESHCVAKAGTNGLPAWSPTRMYLGSSAELKITNGNPGAAPFVLVGMAPGVCVPVAPFGHLAVAPVAVTFNMPPFDLQRVSRTCLPVPWNGGLCSLALTMQAFFGDAGAAGGIAHTDGAKFTIGSQ